MIYQQFAEFYDNLFDEQLYDKWLQYTVDRVTAGSFLLDLACGTGRLAVLLSKAGYKVHGADLSAQMLELADRRAKKTGFVGDLFQADMRDLAELPIYDAITCFDDSLCYLTKKPDLEKTFHEINAHLNDNGTFLFDVITPYQTDEVYPGYMYNFQDDDSAFMWSSYQGEVGQHSVEHELTFFTYNEKKDAYDPYQELHQEVTYEAKDYVEMLHRAGFLGVSITTDFGNQPYKTKIKRWMFECHKEN